jgi:hypothetical protein
VIIVSIYIIICFILAKINTKQIKEDKKVYHGLQGALHILTGLVTAYLINWVYLLLIPLTARIWFTSFLNLMRKLPFFYVTKSPKAKIDICEQKIFGQDGKTPFFIYLSFWLLALVYLVLS